MKKIKAVLTFTVLDKHGEKTVCNMIEPLTTELERVRWRLEDINKSFEITGNITLQFVSEDECTDEITEQ